MSKEIELKLVAILDNPNNSRTYSLVLADKTKRPKSFSMVIGRAEAESIALKLKGLVTPRPLTYDLMTTILYNLNTLLEKVVIYKMETNVFYSNLYFLNDKNEQVVVDARTSDAVALAMCVNAPIFIKSEVMDVVGQHISDALLNINQDFDSLGKVEALTKEELSNLSEENLDVFLKIAIEKENYEVAIQLRNEIKNRRRNSEDEKQNTEN